MYSPKEQFPTERKCLFFHAYEVQKRLYFSPIIRVQTV
jgi:hypothetical protein